MGLEMSRKALLELRTALNEQESKLQAEPAASELDLREKKKLIEDARIVLAAMEEFLNRIIVAPASSSPNLEAMIHDMGAIIHNSTSMTTSAEYQMMRCQLKDSELRIANLELDTWKLKKDIEVIRDQLDKVRASENARKKAEAQARTFAALYEVVSLCEESIWCEGRSQKVAAGVKRSLAAIGRDQKLAKMKELSAQLLKVDMDGFEDIIGASKSIKDACRPYGHVSNDEIKWNKQQLLERANEHLPADMIPPFEKMLAYLSRASANQPYSDQPLFATYITLRKTLPQPL